MAQIGNIESFGRNSDKRTKEILLFGRKFLLSTRTVIDVIALAEQLKDCEVDTDGNYKKATDAIIMHLLSLYSGLQVNYNEDALPWYSFGKRRWYNFKIKKIEKLLSYSSLKEKLTVPEVITLGSYVFSLEMNKNDKNEPNTSEKKK